MTIKIEIETSNAAFEYDAGSEVARILRDIANRIDDMDYSAHQAFFLRDVNGNTVGTYENEEVTQ